MEVTSLSKDNGKTKEKKLNIGKGGLFKFGQKKPEEPKVDELVKQAEYEDDRQINSPEDFKMPVASQVSNSQAEYAMNAFDRSLVVDGIDQIAIPQTKYSKLDRDTTADLFNIVQELSIQERKNLREVLGVEGVSSTGYPFKCFTTLNENITIIATPKQVIESKEKDKYNYDYLESRRGNRIIKRIKVHSVNGISNIYSEYIDNQISKKDQRDIEIFANFFQNPVNVARLEMQNMADEQKARFRLEFQRLGIKDDRIANIDKLTPEQAKQIKERNLELHVTGSVEAHIENGIIVKECTNYLYSDFEDKPRAIWQITQRGTDQNFEKKIYRQVSTGDYVDTSTIL